MEGAIMVKRYFLYLVRWQLSTPILAFSLVFFHFGVTWNTILANLIGGLIFFWVDRYIFTSKSLEPRWEVADNITCADCASSPRRGYRLAQSNKYDRSSAEKEFRCEECSHAKSLELKALGVESYTAL